jgi:molybdate transport system substrate-binding protein
MARSLIVLLTFVLVLLLAACGGAPTATQPTNPPAPTDAPAPTTAATEASDPAATAVPTEAPTTAPTEAATALEGTLTVFAAASLTDAFEELATAFESANPGVEIVYNFGASTQLAAQINELAPADVFASANNAQMRVAIDGGRIISGTQQTFVRNRLVVIMPSDNPAGITSLQDLAQPGLRLVFTDLAVPIGQYSLDFLARASALPEFTESYSPTVLANVVSYEDNVRVVLTKVVLGEGDAAIVYTTDAAIEADNLQQLAIPDELNTIASYPIAPIADSPNPELAQAFVDYVLSPEGQEVLVRYGFISAAENASGATPAAATRAAAGVGLSPRSSSARHRAAGKLAIS